jgi:hypothetical protein
MAPNGAEITQTAIRNAISIFISQGHSQQEVDNQLMIAAQIRPRFSRLLLSNVQRKDLPDDIIVHRFDPDYHLTTYARKISVKFKDDLVAEGFSFNKLKVSGAILLDHDKISYHIRRNRARYDAIVRAPTTRVIFPDILEYEEFIDIVMHDDVEKFIDLVSNPDFQFDMQLKLFDPILSNTPIPRIIYIVRHGALKLFKYCVANNLVDFNIRFTALGNKKLTLLDAALASGNNEIVRICVQNNVKPTITDGFAAIAISILAHEPDLVNFLITNYEPISDHVVDILLRNSLLSFNFKIIATCFTMYHNHMNCYSRETNSHILDCCYHMNSPLMYEIFSNFYPEVAAITIYKAAAEARLHNDFTQLTKIRINANNDDEFLQYFVTNDFFHRALDEGFDNHNITIVRLILSKLPYSTEKFNIDVLTTNYNGHRRHYNSPTLADELAREFKASHVVNSDSARKNKLLGGCLSYKVFMVIFIIALVAVIIYEINSCVFTTPFSTKIKPIICLHH